MINKFKAYRKVRTLANFIGRKVVGNSHLEQSTRCEQRRLKPKGFRNPSGLVFMET